MAKGYLYDNGDELITREDVNEVPSGSSASAGDVLSLDSNKKPKWTTPESGLPSPSSASVGDVLTLDEDKEPVWSAPSGGGGGFVIITCSTTPEEITLDGHDFDYYPSEYTYANTIGAGKIPVFDASFLSSLDDDDLYFPTSFLVDSGMTSIAYRPSANVDAYYLYSDGDHPYLGCLISKEI